MHLEGYELLKAFPGTSTHEAALDIPVLPNSQDMRTLAAWVDALLDRQPMWGYLIDGHGLYAWGQDMAEARRHLEAFWNSPARLRTGTEDAEVSRLRIFDEHDPATPLLATSDRRAMAAGWPGSTSRSNNGKPRKRCCRRSAEAIMAAYRADIDRLVEANGFRSVDVVSIAPDNPNREEMRRKFLDEHFHVLGGRRGALLRRRLRAVHLHVDGKVYEVLCEAGDLIAVPDRTTHWFDMGPQPSFIAIRFFTEPDGWVGHFTGSDIAQRFPR